MVIAGTKKFDVVYVVLYVIVGGLGAFSPRNILYFSTPWRLGLHFVRFLKQIFVYRVLHYTADRPNLQLSTCMVCLCKYHNYNLVANLFSLAFQVSNTVTLANL
jgi:hypothetical protein